MIDNSNSESYDPPMYEFRFLGVDREGEVTDELPMIPAMALDVAAKMTHGCYRHPDGTLRYNLPPPPPDHAGDPQDEGR